MKKAEKKKLRILLLKCQLAYFILVLVLLIFVTLGYCKLQNLISESLYKTNINELHVQDYRTVILNMNQFVPNHFVAIKLYKEDKEIFSIGELKNSFLNYKTEHLTKNNMTLAFYSDYKILIIILSTFLFFSLLVSRKINNYLRKMVFKQLINQLKMQRIELSNDVYKKVAHDIRSPLSSLNIMTEFLTSLPEEQKNIFSQAVSRINSIANDLLERREGNINISYLESNKYPIQCRVYIFPQIKNLISEKRLQLKNNTNIFIIMNNDQNIDDQVIFSKSELERIMSNLLNNAVESLISSKGEITIALTKIGKFIQVTIKDNGKGIPKEILSKIGQKGFSYGKEHLDQSGSGLGLYHAKKTMQEFGGELLIDSEVGVGTTVTLKIPLVDQSIAY